jgi:hypothetical protein
VHKSTTLRNVCLAVIPILNFCKLLMALKRAFLCVLKCEMLAVKFLSFFGVTDKLHK